MIYNREPSGGCQSLRNVKTIFLFKDKSQRCQKIKCISLNCLVFIISFLWCRDWCHEQSPVSTVLYSHSTIIQSIELFSLDNVYSALHSTAISGLVFFAKTDLNQSQVGSRHSDLRDPVRPVQTWVNIPIELAQFRVKSNSSSIVRDDFHNFSKYSCLKSSLTNLCFSKNSEPSRLKVKHSRLDCQRVSS